MSKTVRNKILSSLKGKTVVKATALSGAYGLIGEIEIQFEDGTSITIDGSGEDGGECGRYPGLNVYLEVDED